MPGFRDLARAILPPRLPVRPPAPRLRVTEQPGLIYAVGDIHGRLDRLLELEARIAADAAAIPAQGERWLVTLGDAIDRGPSSAQVIDHLRTAAPAGLRRINLMGNHEAMMRDFLARPRARAGWLEQGGTETLASYGVPADMLRRLDNRTAQQIAASYIPVEHLDYLNALPVLLDTPAALFAHAGLRPGVGVAHQSDDDLLWYRDQFAADYAEFGRPVVHGHTMRDTPLVTPWRIAIDTAAVRSGRLTAVRIATGQPPKLFSTAGAADGR
jgi:serine/threonine protein phosphatase 1